MVSTARIAPFAILGLIGLYPAALAEAQASANLQPAGHVGSVLLKADPDDSDDSGPPTSGGGSAPDGSHGSGGPQGGSGCNAQGVCGHGGPQGGGGSIPGVGHGYGGPQGGGGCVNGVCVHIP